MQNLLDFLKSFFSQPQQFQLGAFKNTEDIRDIHVATVQQPIQIPSWYKTDLFALAVENQGEHGTCVWQALSKLVELYEQKRGVVLPVKRSARSGYIRTKLIDGIPNVQGTYPRVGANVLVKEGIATDSFVPDNNGLSYQEYMNFVFSDAVLNNMANSKLPGYVFVPADFEAVKQAIYQNGAVVGSLQIDANWFSGVIKKVSKPIGLHYTLWYGYDEKGIFGRNSWGQEWGNGGDFYFTWDDYANTAFDIIAFTNIPKDIIENVKKVEYQFTRTMKLGDKGQDVLELQKRLDREGLYPITAPKTGYYGTITAEVVYKYQTLHNVAPQADLDALLGKVCGPATIKELNKNTMTSKIDLWCEATQAHEGYFEGSRSFRNKNPGNLKYVGQASATGKDKDGFCIFPDYETGYNELKKVFTRACLGNSKVYSPEMTLLEFYQLYAPSSDNNNPSIYAAYVAKRIGVDTFTKIKTLI